MENLRALFDLPADQTYLNAAQIGPLPIKAAQAGQQAFADKQHPWRLSTQTNFFDLPEKLRGEAAKLFHAHADDIALIPAASYGLAVAAQNLSLQAGDEIVILDGQFPSNVYTWRALAQRTGAVIRTAARTERENWTDAVLAEISPRTRVVACGALHWIDGGRIDLHTVSEAVKARGAALVLDLTQSLGVMAFDVRAIDPDFAVAACYKWLLGPYATGVLYVAPRHQQGRPLEENWINRSGSEDFRRLIDYRDTYAHGARRFDMGERSNHQLVPAALESLTLINGLGVETIAKRCAHTTERLTDAVSPMGFKADIPDRAGHYLALSQPDDAPEDLAAHLRLKGVHVSQRGPRLRVSPHIYNDAADVERFASAIHACMK